MYLLNTTKIKSTRNLLNLAVVAGLAGFTSISFAQETDTASDADDVEVITVKSERRIKRVQDIPTSMTVLSAKQLEKKAVSRLDDLPFASPGLTITDAGLTQSVNIRGIGLASGDPDVTNGVGTYIDGLFQPPIVSTLNFYDVANIQVLRGPQGTFAGSNSTGGAIMVTSRRPEIGGDFDGNVMLGIGNYASRNARAAVNLPVSDTFAARVAVNYKNRDSFYNSTGSVDTDAGSLDETSARLGLAWSPLDSTDIYVKYETSEKSAGGFAYRPIEGTAYSEGRTGSIRDLAYNTPSQNEESADSLLLDISHRFENGLSVKWLSGTQEKEIDNIYDYDATELDVSTRSQFVKEDQVSHELNLISPDGKDFTWVAGAYYQKNEVLVDIDNGPFPVEIDIQNQKVIKGVFGQVSYRFSDRWQTEFGLRKAWFEGSADPQSGVVVGRGIIAPDGVKVATISGNYEDDDILGKVSVNYTPSRNHSFYGYIARGYKPGGINSETSVFDKETVISIEGGWKGRLFDDTVSASVAVFNNDYKNFQNTNIDVTTGRSDVYNIADASIAGLEFALDIYLDNLTIDFAGSFIDSEMEPTQPIVNTRESGSPSLPQCSAGQDASSGTCFDYTPFLVAAGTGPNLYAPEKSFTVGIEYAIELSYGALLTPRLNYAWIDEQWTNLIYDPETDLLADRGLLSAMVTYETGNWRVNAWGRNLTGEEYVSGQQLSNNTEFYGAPRTFGIDVNYTF
ncbi:MAG: hypothetical protein CL587_00505 [Alteromonadaceae bacterium]|nr:hypothetical protein [Alteromonadaceae bacterium]